MELTSSPMFLSIVNEALGISPTEALEADYVLIVSVLRERGFTLNQRNKQLSSSHKGAYSKETDKPSRTYIDFETGKPREGEKVNFF